MADRAPPRFSRTAARLAKHYGVAVGYRRGKYVVGRKAVRYALLAEHHIRRNWRPLAKQPLAAMPPALYGV